MGRIMALDIGDRRIGIALSDLLKIIANPLNVLVRTNLQSDIASILSTAKQQEVELIVCGLPISMNNTENEQSVKTRYFVDQLTQYTDIPIKFIDERLTTVSAQRVLIEGNVRREDRKNVVDKVAATIILQNYLDYYK
ncbi:MAG: Holliday junction resolvase RuvX [Clostridia bacterium]|nr:Holliday junction resolvase RuvX [Clostridia bacterium]